MALSDLLSGRQVGEIVDDLIELWEMCLRVLDDIKVPLMDDPTSSYNYY